MKYYPIFLDVRRRRCLVIGGGAVALRKIRRLLACGARVTVISPLVNDQIARMKEDGAIEHIEARYCSDLIEEAFLIVGATDDEALNRQISTDARGKGIPANIVDDPGLCDFLIPALFTRGDLTVAVSTSGKSPALAKYIAEELAGNIGDEYGVLAEIMGEIRRIMTGGKIKNRRRLYNELLRSELLYQLKRKDKKGARATILAITGIDMDLASLNGLAPR